MIRSKNWELAMYNIFMAPIFFARYISWHYKLAPGLLLHLWMNMLWYIGHVFSVNSLLRSIFAPWKRVVAQHTKKWNLEDWASAALANFMSRIIGAIMRLFLILIGRALQLTLLVVGAIFYVCWFLLPAIIFFTFFYGLRLIF